MGFRPRSLLVVAPLALLLGCGTAVGDGAQACTEIGAPSGVGVVVDGAGAERANQVRLRACWDGACQRSVAGLTEGTRAVDEGCEGEDPDAVCSARTEPDGTMTGFAEIDLPDAPVMVVARVLDRTARAIAVTRVSQTPALVEPNGPSCPPGGRQLRVVVEIPG
ncbi:hypothetical protein CLV56_1793 [Mumia flava]|uniref:Secreted protein n=1 Tax=Mumia flava TaxID=1348852 RepID=A0A0B2BC62_9ACTN|nr:hypothetical protein [Mumia flava]PJJ57558.1 hypothetical protein CLV56_1793 [Mumia flava]